MPPRDPLDIGEVARRVGVSVAALRLYERRGLLPKAQRSAGGYRQFSVDDVRRARLVRRARQAGLSLRQIEDAITHAHDASRLHALLAAHLRQLEAEGQRIARLRRHLHRWLVRTRKGEAPPVRP